MISVIIPAFNAMSTLPACLEALNKQSTPPDEIIVVDDGSDDNTSQVALAHGAKLLTQPHKGPAAARNLGISQASGAIILFTDADCEPVVNWVAEMLLPFSDPQVVGVRGSFQTHQKEKVARLIQLEFEERYDLQEKRPTIDLIDSSAAAFRVSALQELGGFDPSFPKANNEDVELSYRFEKAGCRLLFNRKAVVFHQHPHTWKAYMLRKIKRGYWRMMVYKMYPGNALRDSYTPQLLKVQIALMYSILGLSALTLLSPIFGWTATIVLISLCLTTIPFIKRALKQDRSLGLSAMFFIILRAFAFSIGIIGGAMGMFFFRPTLSEKNA
jgi:glycosyltransferase involved in cell wall biosynthesis